MKYFLLLRNIFIILPSVLGFESYSGYKVYDVLPNKIQHEQLSQWQYYDGIDFWRLKQPNLNSTVMVEPEQQKDFEKFLTTNQIPFLVQIQDVGPIVEEEHYKIQERIQISPLSGQSVTSADFSVYWSSHEMERYCASLAAEYPNLVKMETITFSHEGRRVYALKISNGREFGQKPIIGLDSGMHSQEWAAPPTVLYFLQRIIVDPVVRDELLEKVDWLVVPMVNPDGYEYTRTGDRLWRKNRRIVTNGCVGVNLNHNFPYSWRPSTVPCDHRSFPGVSPLSENESFHLDRTIGRYATNIKLYMSAHTSGNMIIWPWAYENGGWIHSHAEHQALGEKWRDAIVTNGGRSYAVGNVLDVLNGTAFGAIIDHIPGHYKIPYSYILEISEGHGFAYPEEKLENLVKETFHGYRAMGLYIGEAFGGGESLKACRAVIAVLLMTLVFYD